MASNKNGMYFIAGVCNDKSEVIRELKKICPKDYTVKEYECDNILFAKIVYSEYFDDREPYYVSNVVAVSGYNQEEISKACNSYAFYEIQDSDKYHSLINRLYIRCKEKLFFELESKMDFCSVILNNIVLIPSNIFSAFSLVFFIKLLLLLFKFFLFPSNS